MLHDKFSEVHINFLTEKGMENSFISLHGQNGPSSFIYFLLHVFV